jgi:hypothetical protein
MTNILRNSDPPGFRVGLEDNPPSFRIGRNGEILDAVPVTFPQALIDWLGVPQPPWGQNQPQAEPQPDWTKDASPLAPPPGSLADAPPDGLRLRYPTAPVPQWPPNWPFPWP